MLRLASHCLFRQPVRIFRPFNTRFLSTAPPHLKPRSWKSSAARWGLAIGGIYFYNISTLFAEEPASILDEAPAQATDEALPTLESLSPSSRFRPPTSEEPSTAPTQPTSASPPSLDPKAPSPSASEDEQQSPQDLENDAASQGAFNEETGEINWDCPCLGGMAHGPCGEEFRTAFSCFVFSKEEPKGMDCIEKFKGMQDCFRKHPDVYGDELDGDDDEEMEALETGEESSKVASSLPEDSPGVAAAEKAATELKSQQAQDEPERNPKTSWSATGAEPEASRTEAEPAQERRSVYDAEPEKGSSLEPEAFGGKERLLPDRQGAKSTRVIGEEVDDLVPKAAHDARK